MSGNKRAAAPQSPAQQSSKKAKSNSTTAMVEIDENLHSRQLAVYGREAMRRMAGAAVLISGAGGLGVEIGGLGGTRSCLCVEPCCMHRFTAPSLSAAAKNVILAGVRSVTIHDTKATELRDLSAQFYLTEADVGKNRAEACKDKLQELNTAVAVQASSAALDDAFLKGFQVLHSYEGTTMWHSVLARAWPRDTPQALPCALGTAQSWLVYTAMRRWSCSRAAALRNPSVSTSSATSRHPLSLSFARKRVACSPVCSPTSAPCSPYSTSTVSMPIPQSKSTFLRASLAAWPFTPCPPASPVSYTQARSHTQASSNPSRLVTQLWSHA